MINVKGIHVNRILYKKFMKTLKDYEITESVGNIPFQKKPHLVIEYSKARAAYRASGRIVLLDQGCD